MHFCQLELASQIKIILATGVGDHVKVDRGNKTWLERFIYITNLRNLMGTIKNHGFFPNPGKDMKRLAPEVWMMCQYACFKKYDFKAQYGQIYESMLKAKTFSTTFDRAIHASTFDRADRHISMLPILTIAFIRHLKNTVSNDLVTFPILRRGHYCGAKKVNSNMPLDNLCFVQKKKISGVDENKHSMLTKMRDAALKSTGNPLQIYDFDVLAFSLCEWVISTKSNEQERKKLKNCLTVWKTKSTDGRSIICLKPLRSEDLSEDNQSDIAESPTSASAGSPRRVKKANINKTQMKEHINSLTAVLSSLTNLTTEMMPNQNTSTCSTSVTNGIKKVRDNLSATMLAFAATSELGDFTNIKELCAALGSSDTLQQQSDDSSSSNLPEQDEVDPPDKAYIKSMIRDSGFTGSNMDMSYCPPVENKLSVAMGWDKGDGKTGVSIDDFLLLETEHLKAVYKYYKNPHGRANVDNKRLAEAIKRCKEQGWVSSLELGPKPKKREKIIALVPRAKIEAIQNTFESNTQTSDESSSDESDIFKECKNNSEESDAFSDGDSSGK